MSKKSRSGPRSGEGGNAGQGYTPEAEGVQASGLALEPELALAPEVTPVPRARPAPRDDGDESRRALREAAGQVAVLTRQLAERNTQFNALLSAGQPSGGAARELHDLRRRVAAQAEALQRRESRRRVFDSQLREQDAALGERDAEIARLRADLDMLQQGGMPASMEAHGWSAAPEPTPAGQAEARIASLSVELARLHARAAMATPTPGVPAEPAGPDDGLKAEIFALRRANDQLRAELAEREAQRSGKPAPRDTGTFAATSDFSSATGSGSFALADGELRMFVRTEGDAGIVHVLGRRATMGRAPDNDLSIDFESVSRHHAVALQTPGGTVIEDLNSTNGVFVNGHRVSRRVLTVGDLVTIGVASFRFLVKPADEAANS